MESIEGAIDFDRSVWDIAIMWGGKKDVSVFMWLTPKGVSNLVRQSGART